MERETGRGADGLGPRGRQGSGGQDDVGRSSRGETRQLLAIGMRVQATVGSRAQHGVVQYYEPHHSQEAFPVLFGDGVTRLMSADECTVLSNDGPRPNDPASSGKARP